MIDSLKIFMRCILHIPGCKVISNLPSNMFFQVLILVENRKCSPLPNALSFEMLSLIFTAIVVRRYVNDPEIFG